MPQLKLTEKSNIFMDPIYKKDNKFFGLFSYLRLRKTIKYLRTTMPNFALLWQLSDFIKLLEKVYFYNNSQSNVFYSSLKYDIGENGFRFRDNNVIITFKLHENNNMIMLDISRNKGNNLKSSMEFYDNDTSRGSELNKDDLSLFETCINTIIEESIHLMKYYYKMKGKRNDESK